MDSNRLVLITFGVLAAIIGLGVLRGLGRRKIRESAQRRHATVLPEMLAAFGRSLVLGTDPARVTALVDALPRSKAKPLRPGVWGIDSVTKTDVVIEARPTAAGTELLVTSLVAYQGKPQGLPVWQRLLEQLEQAATAAGVPVQHGNHTFQFSPEPANNVSNGVWSLSDGATGVADAGRHGHLDG